MFNLSPRSLCWQIICIIIIGSASCAMGQSPFTGKPIAPGQIAFSALKPTGNRADSLLYINQYELTNRSNLFIKVSLKSTLSAYLSSLAPLVGLDSLSKIGNYQFSFYIDHHLIYQTNLLPGAPSPSQQQTETIWSKPLIDNEHEGAWWSQSAWNRMMYNGGDSALTDGKHILTLELRPYVKQRFILTGPVIARGELPLIVKRKPLIDMNAVSLNPILAYNGFAAAKDNFDRNKIKELKAYIVANAFKHITSVVVIKKGKILVEEYFNGATRDSLHDVRSVGKSFASTLTGIAIQDGYLSSEQQQLKEFYPIQSYKNYAPEKENTSLKALLTMSSVFDGDDDDASSPGNEENMYPTANWLNFALDLPVNTQKYQGQWHYFTTGVMLLGNVLHQKVPDGLEQYAEKKLFKPLGIHTYQWQYTPQHVVSTAGGIRMNSLDFAKYGQLYKNNGKWNKVQVVPKEWINKSMSKQIAIPGRKNEYYGYLFWNKTYHNKEKAYETIYSSGNGGNKIFVFKDEPLVVVITATAYGTGYAHQQADKIIEQYILPAVFEKQ